MKNKIITLLMCMAILFSACTNRDKNGSTDASNSDASKAVTDHTR
jgi:hypothetical protein